MTRNDQAKMDEATTRVIESVRETAEPALEAVRTFVETVSDALPDLEDGPRRRIIEAGFKMTEDLVGLSARFAARVVTAGHEHRVAKTAA
jgi:hypothetical protein